MAGKGYQRFMRIARAIFRKVYNRVILPILIREQTKRLPALIAQLNAVRNTEKELGEILEVVKQKPRSIIPYKYVESYQSIPVKTSHDASKRLPFAIVNQRKIYFPAEFDHNEIAYRVRQSLWEQADESPHRYFHQRNTPPNGRNAALLGASDCIFATRIVNHFDKVFLFEGDKKWHGPMRETLSEFLEKVVFVDKWVGNKDEGKQIRLDTYFERNHEDLDYIQADIEGAEMEMLWGAEKVLENSPRLNLSISCYHNAQDEAEIGDFLKGRGYRVRPSEGYMLLFMQYPLKYPYLRRGVLYASKSGFGA